MEKSSGSFGQIIKKKREEAGLTRKGLAAMIGATERNIADIEDNGLFPSREVFGGLIRSLNINNVLYGVNYEGMEMAIWAVKQEGGRFYDPEIVLRKPFEKL